MSTLTSRVHPFPFVAGLLFALPMVGAVGCQRSEQPVAPAAGVPAAEGPEAEGPEAEEALPADEPRRAEVGVGRQGRSLDDNTGVGGAIAEPARTLFAVRERAVFEIQIPHAMQLFEATEGRKPTSHDEFMQRIVRDNQIQLPELPEGKEYRYRPDEGELWVYPEE